MKQRILFAALALLLFAACHKEPLDPRMEIFVEHMQGSAKLTLDGVNATWNNGDTLRLNGTRVVVERSGDHAYISNAASQSTNRALFPTRLVASGPASDAVTVTLPREYDYRSDGSHQLLDLPLAARATDGEPLHFKHLTGALCFMLTNNTSNPLTIDRITVSSSSYQLSGERNINLASIGSIGPAAGAGDDRTVNMTFTRQSLVIPASGTANVVLPIAPVGSDNIFTVTVVSHYQGTRYTYTKTQGEGKTDRSLARNEIGYATVNLEVATLTPDPLFAGYGTLSDPYRITTPTEFLLMVDAISQGWNNPNSTKYRTLRFKLTSDLDLNGITIYPIQNYEHAKFDGNNHTIYNLTINSRSDTCALFSNPNSVTLSNLTLNNLTLKHSGNADKLYLGGFCGYIFNDSILNCDINGLTLSISGTINELYFGSLAAHAYRKNILNNCDFTTTNTLSLSATAFYYGNLIGRGTNGNENYDLKLTSCTASTSTVSLTSTTGLHYAGGLVGYNSGENLILSNCTFNGTINSSAPTSTTTLATGGLAGRHLKSGNKGDLTTTSCTVQGTISATTSSGSAYIGAYFGMSNVTPSFSTCTKNISLSLNGTPVSNDIGNQ